MNSRKACSIFGYFILTIACASISNAQPANTDFITYQKSFKKVGDAFKTKEDSLKKEFETKGLKWPAKFLYARSFKYDGLLEVWVKNTATEAYKLFKTYKVCALAGTLGPKRLEGDYQVPEGFYYLNEFKPNSSYHLALGINYPNVSDKILSDSVQPGSDIYIHGSCVTVGCIPIRNEQIEELYVLSAITHNQGQDFIPIHVFPIVFKNLNSLEYLNKFVEAHPDYEQMMKRLKYAYYYFEEKKALPLLMTDVHGDYNFGKEIKLVFEENKVPPLPPTPKLIPRLKATPVSFDEKLISKSVYRQTEYPGGIKAFQEFLNKLSAELAPMLPQGRSRSFVQVEYIVSNMGKIILPVVLSGATNAMNNIIIKRFEAMPNWTPAKNEKDEDIAVKLQQVIEVNELK